MRTLAGIFVLLMSFAVPAVAQDAAPNPPQDQPAPQDQTAPPPAESPKPKAPPRHTPKFELSAGFAHRSYSLGAGSSSVGMNGLYGSVEYNWKTWLGFAADGLGVYNRVDSNQTESIYTFLVGPQIYPFKHRKLTPFGQFLYGAGYYRENTSPYGGFGSATKTDLSRAWEGGGGLDLNLRKHWGIRLVQFDYGSTHFFSGSGAPSQSSYRVSVGVVYRFGER